MNTKYLPWQGSVRTGVNTFVLDICAQGSSRTFNQLLIAPEGSQAEVTRHHFIWLCPVCIIWLVCVEHEHPVNLCHERAEETSRWRAHIDIYSSLIHSNQVIHWAKHKPTLHVEVSWSPGFTRTQKQMGNLILICHQNICAAAWLYYYLWPMTVNKKGRTSYSGCYWRARAASFTTLRAF